MADTDDIIDSILNEEDNIEIDYNKTNYDINSILNENNDPLEMNEESKDPEKNIIKDNQIASSQESQNEASKESSDNKSKEQQNKDDNNELLKKEKDEQLKRDLEKVFR